MSLSCLRPFPQYCSVAALNPLPPVRKAWPGWRHLLHDSPPLPHTASTPALLACLLPLEPPMLVIALGLRTWGAPTWVVPHMADSFASSFSQLKWLLPGAFSEETQSNQLTWWLWPHRLVYFLWSIILLFILFDFTLLSVSLHCDVISLTASTFCVSLTLSPELNPTRVRNSRSICTISEWMNDWIALIWYPIQRKIVSTRV